MRARKNRPDRFALRCRPAPMGVEGYFAFDARLSKVFRNAAKVVSKFTGKVETFYLSRPLLVDAKVSFMGGITEVEGADVLNEVRGKFKGVQSIQLARKVGARLTVGGSEIVREKVRGAGS